MLGLWAFLAIGAVSMFAIFLPVTTWLESRRKEREAFYKSETLRRIAESSPNGAKAALELMEQQNYNEQVKKREGIKIGGLGQHRCGCGAGCISWVTGRTEDRSCRSDPGFIGVALLDVCIFHGLAYRAQQKNKLMEPWLRAFPSTGKALPFYFAIARVPHRDRATPQDAYAPARRDRTY